VGGGGIASNPTATAATPAAARSEGDGGDPAGVGPASAVCPFSAAAAARVRAHACRRGAAATTGTTGAAEGANDTADWLTDESLRCTGKSALAADGAERHRRRLGHQSQRAPQRRRAPH